MRILLVTEALVLGGAETFVLRLARRLRQDGYLAEILCLNPDYEDARLVEQFPDVPIHRVPLRGLRTLKRVDRVGRMLGLDLDFQIRRTALWVDRNLIGRYEIYHTNLFGADWLFTRLKQKRPGLRIVATLHGDYGLFEEGLKGTERSFVLDWRKKLAQTISAVDRWVTISRAQHRQFEQSFGVDPKRLVAIPNGYAPPAPIRPSERTIGAPLTFVMVARGIREKGWGFLVESFGRLQGNCRLMLVGEGAYLDQLRAKHASDPQITFAGIHANPVEAIRNCDLFVHPSIYKAESLPTVIIEALFAGVPVIATDVGEVATMLSAAPGQLAGTLVSADESTLTEQLTTSMQGYIDCPDLLARHAALASAAFAKFDMGCCAAAYARLYSEVLGLPSSKSSTRVSH